MKPLLLDSAKPEVLGRAEAELARQPKLTAHQRQEAIARRETGETLVDIARSYNVSHPTIMRLFPSPFDQKAASAAA